MAKHETEMHRHRRELLDAMQEIIRISGDSNLSSADRLSMIAATAQQAIKSCGGLAKSMAEEARI